MLKKTAEFALFRFHYFFFVVQNQKQHVPMHYLIGLHVTYLYREKPFIAV